MRYTDPEDSMMHELAAALDDSGDLSMAPELLRSGMQQIANELNRWINSKSLFDAPFVAAALILAGNGMMSALDPPAQAAAQSVLNLLGAAAVKIPYREDGT